MSDSTPHPEEAAPPTTPAVSVPAINNALELEAHLADLMALMERQIARIQEENYDAFLDEAAVMEALLQAVAHAQVPITPTAFQSIQAIHGLHHRLGLLLASRSKETAEQLDKMRSGKQIAKAYRTQ
jgi:hypothetical protein